MGDRVKPAVAGARSAPAPIGEKGAESISRQSFPTHPPTGSRHAGRWAAGSNDLEGRPKRGGNNVRRRANPSSLHRMGKPMQYREVGAPHDQRAPQMEGGGGLWGVGWAAGRRAGRQADRHTDGQQGRKANRPTDRRTDKQTTRQTGGQTARQSNRQTDRPQGRPAGSGQADEQTGGQADRPADRQKNRQTDRQTGERARRQPSRPGRAGRGGVVGGLCAVWVVGSNS